jgi:hypothetical protein
MEAMFAATAQGGWKASPLGCVPEGVCEAGLTRTDRPGQAHVTYRFARAGECLTLASYTVAARVEAWSTLTPPRPRGCV